MTDKQIIINGVDVSGCDFLAKKDDYCSYSGITYAYKGQCMCSDEEMCKEHPKCFYKKVLKQLKAKEQECEELKEEKQGLIKDWEEKKNLGYEIACKNEKLKETLAEIKEIALSTLDCGEWIGQGDNKVEQILQKISEVINER